MLLQSLFHDGPRSRADIARLFGLNKVTVSAIVSELIEQGIVFDAGQSGDVRVGKPATLVAIDDASRAIIGLDLSDEREFRGAVMNLRGTPSAMHRLDVPADSADTAIARVIELTQTLIDKADTPVLGIGVGSPGVVDRAGIVRFAPRLGWFDTDLSGMLRERFGVPVHVVNDANGMALAAHTLRDNDGGSILVVSIQRGIGAGLIVSEKLIDGEDFAAGEIGHVVVDADRSTTCLCERNGCLESIVAIPELRRRLADGEARESIWADAADMLARAVAPIIAVLGSTRVVLVGPEDVLDSDFAVQTQRRLTERTLPATTRKIRVEIGSEGGLLALQGAAVAVLSAELGIS